MLKSSQFNKAGACSSRSTFVETSRASRVLDEAILIKDFCKDFISENLAIPKLSDLEDEIAASYSDETLDDIDETQAAYVKRLAKQIWRYGKSQLARLDKDDEVIIPEESFIINLSDDVENDFPDSDQISVTIDAIVFNKEQKYAQAIVYKRGTPKLGKSSQAYKNVANDIPINLMMIALEQFVAGRIGDKDTYRLTASYYYMKKSSDTNDKAIFADYFHDDAPIREIWGTYSKKLGHAVIEGQTQNPDNTYYKRLLELVNQWAKGFDKCDMKEAEDCEGCPDYCMCYYSLAPTAVPVTGEKKKRAKCTPTEEQKAIINAREGIFLCNAVPGSGKTETAIKQRTVSIILDELDEIIKKAEAGEDITEYLKPANTYLTKDSRRVDPEKVYANSGTYDSDLFA